MDQLSPEEQVELAALEAEDQLSPEEQAELDSYEKEDGDINPVSQGQIAAAQVTNEHINSQPEQEQSSMVSTVSDAVNGVGDFIKSAANAIPGVDEAAAFMHSITSDDTYEQSMQQLELEEAQREIDSPTIDVAGNMVGNVLASAGLYKAAKAIPAVGGLINGSSKFKHAPKAAAFVTSVAVDTGVSLENRLNDEQINTMEGMLSAAKDELGSTAMWSLVGGGVGKGLSKIMSGRGGALTSEVQKMSIAANTSKNIELINQRLDQANVTPEKFYKSLSRVGIGEIKNLKYVGQPTKIIKKGIEDIGGEIGDGFGIIKDKVTFEGSEIFGEFSAIIDKGLGNADLSTKGSRLMKNLEKRFYTVIPEMDDKVGLKDVYTGKKFNLQDLNITISQLKDDLANSDVSENVKKRALKYLSDKVDNGIRSVASGADGDSAKVAKKLMKDRLDYGNLKVASKVVKSAPKSINDGTLEKIPTLAGNFMTDLKKGALAYSVPGAAVLMSGGSLPMAMGATAAGVLPSAMKKSQAFLAKTAGAMQSIEDSTLQKKILKYAGVEDFLNNTKDSLAASGALASKLNLMVNGASQESNPEDVAKLYEVGASIKSFNEMPLTRDSKGFDARSKDILNIVNHIDPSVGEQLAETMKNGQDVGPIMDMLSKHPQARGLIEDGQGWGGKVYSPEDKIAIANEIKQTFNINGSRKQQMIKELMATGVIPDLNAEPKRQKLKYNPRDKKKTRY